MDTQIIKNIVSEKEIKKLVDWISLNKDTSLFRWSGHPGTRRRTTRFSLDVDYPDISYKIRDRIKSQLGIKSDYYPDYPDGMVASYGYARDECSFHKDPIWFENHITYHCVVLLSAPESGGIPIIGDVEYPLEEGDGVYYPVSEIIHGTTKLIGNKPRILWIFGFSIPCASAITDRFAYG